MNYKEWRENLVVGKNPCYRCRQRGGDSEGDHFTYYGDGLGGYCFNPSCNFTIPSDDYLEELEANKEPQEYSYEMSKDFNEEVHEELKSNTGVDSKGYRGIRADISRSLGVRYEYSEEDGSVVKSYYPITENCLELGIPDSLVGYKVRGHPKDFYSIGRVGKGSDLFAQWKFPTHNNILVICAGEIDQMSAYQMLLDAHNKRDKEGKWDEIAVVSSTNGEGGTAAQVRRQYQWVSQFSKVIVCLDNDEAGRKATEEVVKVLPRGKAFVMNLRYKDVNEYLVQGKEQEFIRDFWGHRPYVPVGVKGSSELYEDLINSAKTIKIPLPPFMHKLQDLMAGGIPLGTIVNLGSASGQGKSTFAEELVYYWIFNSPYKVGVLSLESDSGDYGTKLLSRHLGRKIHLIEDADEKLNYLKSEHVREKARELFTKSCGSNRFYLMDERGASVEDIKKSVERLVQECQCSVLIIDPLQDVIASLPLEEQVGFMTWQKELIKSSGVTFININHVRKSPSTSKAANSQGADISEEDFEGSSSIFKSGACNLLFTRNKEHEDYIVRNTTIMKMTKCRWTGNTSPVAGQYFYDNRTHTLYDLEDYKAKNPHLFLEEREG